MITMFRVAIDVEKLAPQGGRLDLSSGHTSASRHATGRGALAHLIKRMPAPFRKTVLLPCYVAEGVISPFASAQYEIRFYKLKPDLTPSVDDLNRLLMEAGGVAVVVVIHYFGFSADSEELRAIFEKYHPVVVSDCAHALFNAQVAGRGFLSEDEVVLYSLNKFLPVVDGAIVASNRGDIDLAIDESGMPELPAPVISSYQLHLDNARELLACQDTCQAVKLLGLLAENYEKYYEFINSSISGYRQSRLSCLIESSLCHRETISRRLENSAIVYSKLNEGVFSFVRPIVEGGNVPFCVPVRVPHNHRKEISDALFQKSIILSTLQAKWDFIPSNLRARYIVESRFLDEHLLIPISEFLTAAEVNHMVRELNAINL